MAIGKERAYEAKDISQWITMRWERGGIQAFEVMESGLNGPEAIPMVKKIQPSRSLQGSFALADDGIRYREAPGTMTPSRK